MHATRLIFAVLILVGGLSLAKAVYDAGYGCTFNNVCFSSNVGLSKIITLTSIGVAAGIVRTAKI